MLQILLMIAEERDREKIKRLYETYHSAMLRIAHERLKKWRDDNAETDAEDVVQNAWYKIVKHIDKIDGLADEQSVRGYVFVIVCNEAARFMGERHVELSLNEGVDDTDFIEQLNLRENYRAVVEAIKRMEERYSNALYLHYVMETPVKEVAALLGVSEKTVYTRLARGKQKLLEELGKEGIYG